MSQETIAAARARRDAARDVFDTRLGRIKADIEARGVGSRVADTVVGEASDALDVGLDVAREHKALIAGTIGGVLLWVFRQPLVAAVAALSARFASDSDDDSEDELSDESE